MDEGDTNITQYIWDARNRLTEVTSYATYGGSASQMVDYLYDVENRWIGKRVDDDGDGLIDHETRFAYDGTQIVLQFESSSPLPLGEGGEGSSGASALTVSDLSHRYLWQPDVVDQLLADEALSPLPLGEGQGEGGEGGESGSDGYDLTVPGDVVWALNDQLGTVRDLAVHDAETDVTTIANHRVYDSFGNLTSESNNAVDCLFGYTGRAYDEATGLQNNWHRWYDAKTGSWISKDWMGFTAGDANTSRYVGNSPTNATDPTGLEGPWDDPNGNWKPEIFFLGKPGLKEATRWGCGGLAAWRAGVGTQIGMFWPYDIVQLPGAKAYGKWEDAINALKALGQDGGLIIAIQQKVPFLDGKTRKPLDISQINGMPASDIRMPQPGNGNFATYLGTASKPFWEYANWGWGQKGAEIKHSSKLPKGFSEVLFIVVPNMKHTWGWFQSPHPS